MVKSGLKKLKSIPGGYILNLKANFNEMKKATTVKELLSILDYNILINCAFFILVAIILTPFIALFTGYYSFLTNYILFFGFLGCGVTLLSFFIGRFSFRLKNIEYFKLNIVPVFLFMMLIWSIFACIFSTNPEISFYGSSYREEGLLMYFAYCGFFGCGYIAAKGNKLHILFNLLSAVAFILAVFMIINSPVLNFKFHTEQIHSVFYQKNHAGYYFCLATILSTVEILRLNLNTKKDKIKFILRLILVGFLLYGNILTNSTGSFLAIIFGGCALIFASALFNRKILKHCIFIFITFIFVTIISIFTGKSPLLDVLQVFIDFGTIIKDTRSEEALQAGTTRWLLWLHAIDFIKEKPVFGFGPDNLEEPYLAVGLTDTRPHNEFLQHAAALGIPAAIFYLISVVTFTVTYFKKKIDNPIVIGLVCTVGAYVFSSLFGNSMFYTTPFFFMIFGMATSVIKDK